MRPDHFMRKVEAYHYNEQKSWLPWRKLYTMFHNSFSEESCEETEMMWLPMIDELEEEQEIVKPAILSATPEEIRRIMIEDGIIKE